jgi:seryl-tRNA synthetase
MIDIKWIVQNPQKFDKIMQNRQQKYQAAELIKLYEESKQKIAKIQNLQQQRNKVADEVAYAKRDRKNFDHLIEKAKEINFEIKELQDKKNDNLLNTMLLIPNIYEDEIPVGKDENSNVEIEKWGEIPQFSFKVKSHDELGENLGLLDFKQAGIISGARFSILRGALSKMERALANFMLDIIAEYEYEEISPPLLVKDNAMIGSGQLPKFSEDAFVTTNGHWLIPTAEVPLVNMAQDCMLKAENLPQRFASLTPCFRSEAGSSGKDTKGIIREHQFKKVELVSIAKAEDSTNEHERMTSIACKILQKLQLPYRKMLLCSGDIGFSAQKTYDLEVWVPSQNKYREISSCSNCGDFQARRIKARYKNSQGKNILAHTLNGSSLAIGRTIVAILENYQQEDGSVKVPEALKKYLGADELMPNTTFNNK